MDGLPARIQDFRENTTTKTVHTEVPCMKDALAIRFNQKHIAVASRVIDAERRYMKLADYELLARCHHKSVLYSLSNFLTREVIAKGISSVTKKSAITANNIKHLIAGDIRVPPS